MNNFKKGAILLTVTAIALMQFTACNFIEDPAHTLGNGTGEPNSGITDGDSETERPDDDNDVTDIEVDDNVYDYVLKDDDDGNYVYEDDEGNTAEFTVSYVSGTDSCYSVSGNTLTFGGLTEDSVYAISGAFYGNIVIDAGEDYKLELELKEFALTSYSECPIAIKSGDKVTLSAKKDTVNYIYDQREEVGEEEISASIYALCDLDVQGKGELYVKSLNNNGIHTKDDLNVKNLTLQVECKDNALKGNDSVTIESGKIVLISSCGDGIKTTNTDVSSKGNQRGTITITGGDILIYAACDGIDAAYDVVINEDTATPYIQIFTDKYSKYSEEVTATADDVYYVRYTSDLYKYSIRYFNDEDEVWYSSSSYSAVNAGRNKYYYYSVTKPSGYSNMQLFVYSSAQEQGQSENYVYRTDTFTINSNYDTLALQKRGNSFSCEWTNYTTSSAGNTGGFGGNMGGNMGGLGGMNEGNTDKGDHSTKGIKAGNAVNISSGTIQISSYDDSIHANKDATLENGDSPLGNVTVSGGTLTLYTNDDGIHADGTTELSGGVITIAYSYEGIEGGTVKISGGKVSVTYSRDDGVNSTSTSKESIVISGGYLYVYAGGDGIDSNSTSSYDGILISGGYSVIIATGSSDSSIDAENGYKYTRGYVAGIGSSGGMSNEATACSPSFNTVGTKSTLNLTKDNYLVIENFVTVKLPVSINATVIFLGSTNASIKSSSSTSLSLDSDGVCWSI